jgi:tetratricopeptide (TPR) repeat protein
VCLKINYLFRFIINKMGNAESLPSNNDRPLPLAIEAKSLVERGFYEAAVAKYKRSYDLYKESGAHASAGRSLRLAAETGLIVPTPDYELAATAFEEVGTLYLMNEITAFLAKTAHANAILSLLAAGRIATAKGKYAEFIKKDKNFEPSLDGVAAKSIMEAYQNGNRNQAVDRIDAFKDIEIMPTWRETLLNKIIDRL